MQRKTHKQLQLKYRLGLSAEWCGYFKVQNKEEKPEQKWVALMDAKPQGK